ncbi:hypothetical protein [Maricaulis salignorans]|uniref:Uncharacterized protein n=1 Tax=Maricaulis salignorans TaxID=144026 RepID=A0A1G9UAK4_9PROT|nr:hypothetical protein [Maricaulis salignorans]SDM56987.1 hypothetical protein SAMN04488568_11462 [Maricaulis salignorans]
MQKGSKKPSSSALLIATAALGSGASLGLAEHLNVIHTDWPIAVVVLDAREMIWRGISYPLEWISISPPKWVFDLASIWLALGSAGLRGWELHLRKFPDDRHFFPKRGKLSILRGPLFFLHPFFGFVIGRVRKYGFKGPTYRAAIWSIVLGIFLTFGFDTIVAAKESVFNRVLDLDNLTPAAAP